MRGVGGFVRATVFCACHLSYLLYHSCFLLSLFLYFSPPHILLLVPYYLPTYLFYNKAYG